MQPGVQSQKQTQIKEIQPMQTPKCFTLTVTDFKNVLDTTETNRGTRFTMKPTGPRNPLVGLTLYKTGKLKGCVKTIKVGTGVVALRFQVEAARKDSNHYCPVGLAFMRKTQKGTGKLGGAVVNPKVFPPHELVLDEENRAVSVTADFSGRTIADKGHYEFYLFIQRESDGALGIIDPPLDHDH
jgi:hypothetical protein